MIGNCQAEAAASVMRLLCPGAEVTFETVHGIARRHRTMAGLAAAYAGHDVVFANRLSPAFAPFPDGGFEVLQAETRLVPIPVVIFPAFHPDLVFVGDVVDPGRAVRTPVGRQNSAIALAAFRAGFAPEEAVRLFGRETYRRLGYLDAWEPSMAGLLALGHEAGYDLAADAARWARRGAFMHSVEHPRLSVIADVARALLRRAGLGVLDLDPADYLPDELLAAGMWPVYPEIGERYGVPGATTFLARPARRGAPPRPMGLEAFVAGSYAAYAGRSPAALACPRVEGWLADAALRADLARLAGRPVR